jgi:hypothetical protein
MAGMRLIRGTFVQFVGISSNVTFASHMFRLNVAETRFCFNLCRRREISVSSPENRNPPGSRTLTFSAGMKPACAGSGC